MAAASERPSELELKLPGNHPALLTGLDTLVQLGLVSDAQVRELGQQFLTCTVPAVVARSEDFVAGEFGSGDFVSGDFVPDSAIAAASRSGAAAEVSSVDRSPVLASRSPTRRVPRVLASLMNELSIVWLLFLGVFLVVVSSAVLAATQWQNTTATGQYAILLGYTAIFGLAGVFTARQTHLQTTSRMLQAATLLLIPINFWMIDGFQIWQEPAGMGVAAIAAIALTGLALWLLRHDSLRVQGTLLLLSWLHWGWQGAAWPLVATYLGAVGSTILMVWEDRRRASPLSRHRRLLEIAFGNLLLVGRALGTMGLTASALGLAWGLLGALLLWLTRSRSQPALTLTGVVLMLSAWGATVETAMLPAIVLSVLGLLLLAERLQRYGQAGVLIGLLGVGLQTWWLVWLALPLGTREAIAQPLSLWSGQMLLDYQRLGLWTVPFLWGMLGLAVWLQRRQWTDLVRLTEGLALALGGVSLLLVLGSPEGQSLTLALFTGTLLIVWWRHPQPGRWLAYLANGTLVSTVLSLVYLWHPTATLWQWGLVLLASTAGEWLLLLGLRSRAWRWSCWHLGLGLASGSYLVLFLSAWLTYPIPVPERYLVWLAVPILLIGLNRSSTSPQPRLAGWLGMVSCLLMQGIVLVHLDTALISLGVCTGLGLLLSQRLNHRLATVLTVGLGLSCSIVLNETAWQLPFLLWQGVMLWGIWGLWGGLGRRSGALTSKFRWALNGWGLALTVINLLALMVWGLSASLFFSLGELPQIAQAAAITTGALALRTGLRPTNLSCLGLVWGLELTLWTVIALNGWPPRTLMVVNAALALTTQLAGDWGLRRGWYPHLRWSWMLIPLIFVGLSFWQAHLSFTAVSGLVTLVAALVVVGVGRRHYRWRVLTYLGIWGLTVGASEWVIYQLQQATGGSWADGVTVLAVLPTVIAIAYAIGQRPLVIWWQRPRRAIRAIAHWHWVYGSFLIGLTLAGDMSPTLLPLWSVVLTGLLAYAAAQGRRTSKWIYAAVAQLTLLLAYGLDQIFTGSWLGYWAGAIATLVATLLYLAPWSRWGWPQRPWQQAAKLLPGGLVALSVWVIGIPSLLVVGGFYGWVAFAEQRMRLSYISLVLANWACWRWLIDWNLQGPLGGMALLSLSLLYGAQVDPALRSPDRREPRHWVRSLALGLFCLTALYQSDGNLWQGFLVILLGIVLGIAGLMLRLRAALYVGTLTFLIKVLRQLWLFVSEQSLLLWVLGISLGVILIGLAVTFESRRSQAIAWVQYWVNELEAWD